MSIKTRASLTLKRLACVASMRGLNLWPFWYWVSSGVENLNETEMQNSTDNQSVADQLPVLSCPDMEKQESV